MSPGPQPKPPSQPMKPPPKIPMKETLSNKFKSKSDIVLKKKEWNDDKKTLFLIKLEEKKW